MFGVLRIFALSNKTWPVTLLSALLGLVPIAMNIVSRPHIILFKADSPLDELHRSRGYHWQVLLRR